MSVLMKIAAGVVLLAGGMAIIYGVAAWGAHCYWVWQFKSGMARDIRNSVKLGWNTGVPDDGQWVLVRENMPKRGTCHERLGDRSTATWAVMQRRGDMLHSQTGGYSMPIGNLTGWLAVEAAHD